MKFTLLMALTFLASPVFATPITYVFSGTACLTYGFGCEAPPSIPISGLFTIDDVPVYQASKTVKSPVDGSIGEHRTVVYESEGGPFGMLIDYMGQTGVSEGVHLSYNDEPDPLSLFPSTLFGDTAELRTIGGGTLLFRAFFSMEDSLSASPLTLGPNLDLNNMVPCTLDQFGCRLGFVPASGILIDDLVFARSPFVIPVPEPSTLGLLAISIALTCWNAFRKSR